jgi:hypothetical protein
MALSNFVLMLAGVSAMILLPRSNVKQSVTVFRCNVKHICHWLEEEPASALCLQVKNLLYFFFLELLRLKKKKKKKKLFSFLIVNHFLLLSFS